MHPHLVLALALFTPADAPHWAFRPVAPTPPPAVADAEWASSVDRFVRSAQVARGLTPTPPAGRETLLRRVTLGLTGLPPTPEALDAFLADTSPDALARVVDRLLETPEYGERWGRHWLDVARYADTAGDGADYPAPEAYRYRDYVIRAIRADKPFDRFVREQVAGDLLALSEGATGDAYADLVTATGFLAVGKRFGYNVNREFEHLDHADTIDSVGRAVLGLSLGCARCHDHKYDPVSAREYYALYGVLASSTFAFPGGEEHKRPANLSPLVPPAEFRRREAERAAEVSRHAADAARALEQARGARGRPELAAAVARHRDAVARRDAAAGRELCDHAYAVSEGTPANAHIQKRGEPTKPGPEVPRGFLAVLGGDTLPTGAAGSGRRELADWLTRPSNPLTARVLVNRVWQHHFGRGIVGTPSDFGTRGERPTHPELLDWLADDFARHGWSLKRLHRQLLLSRAYRGGADASHAAREADPDNRLLARFARRRLDAESIRDGMLFVSGRLAPGSPGRHPFPPPASWGFTIHAPFQAVYESDRRSVYLMVQRQVRHPYLALFDGADPNTSTDVRPATTTPTQALHLLNAPEVHAAADALAARLLASPGAEAERLRDAFRRCHGRAADAVTLGRASAFLAACRGRGVAERDAWAGLGRVLLTANAYLYVD